VTRSALPPGLLLPARRAASRAAWPLPTLTPPRIVAGRPGEGCGSRRLLDGAQVRSCGAPWRAAGPCVCAPHHRVHPSPSPHRPPPPLQALASCSCGSAGRPGRGGSCAMVAYRRGGRHGDQAAGVCDPVPAGRRRGGGQRGRGPPAEWRCVARRASGDRQRRQRPRRFRRQPARVCRQPARLPASRH
jgi:hypothetical protein